MAKKKEVYKIKPLYENKKNIISALINEYDIETAADIRCTEKVQPYSGAPENKDKKSRALFLYGTELLT